MTFEQLRITYQSDEQMARALFDQLAMAQRLHELEQSLRIKAEKKLAAASAPSRTHRGEN